jgi:hypothetical protein
MCDDPSSFVGQIPPAGVKAPGFEELREPVPGCVHVQTTCCDTKSVPVFGSDTKSDPVFGSGSGCSGVSTCILRRISPSRTQLCTARRPAVVPDVLRNGAALAARFGRNCRAHDLVVPLIHVVRACGSCAPGGRCKLELCHSVCW